MTATAATLGLLCGAPPEPFALPGRVYFIQPTTKLPDFDSLEPVSTIYTNPLSVGPVKSNPGFPGITNRAQWFAVDYQGKIYIRHPGVYRFRLVSDDGSKLYIDGLTVIDNDRGLGVWTDQKAVKLSGGMHRIRLSYFQGPTDHYYITLVLSVSPPASKRFASFDIHDFTPPSTSDNWPYGSPADFAPDPDPNAGRIRLKDVISKKNVTGETVIASVRTEIRRRAADQAIAKALDQVSLGQELDPAAVDVLQGEGAGPQTVAALERLRDASSTLPAAAESSPFQFPHPPTAEEQKELLDIVRANALQYQTTLPNFICTQVVNRAMMAIATPGWVPKDVLTVRLTYFANHENYVLTAVNGQPTKETYESAGGAVFERDFGTPFLQVFAPSAETTFAWHHWTLLRKRLTQVYSYRTPKEHSTYTIAAAIGRGPRTLTIAGRHGFIYVDNETQMVVRIAGESDSIPRDFHISAQSNVLDYDYAEVGGHLFLLPLRAYQQLTAAPYKFRNTTEFRDYRKFTGESKITFDQKQ